MGREKLARWLYTCDICGQERVVEGEDRGSDSYTYPSGWERHDGPHYNPGERWWCPECSKPADGGKGAGGET